MMGTITTSVKSYASDKSFKKDNNIEIDKFYTRMMMGGNKRNGIILNGETKMRTVFDLEEREYTPLRIFNLSLKTMESLKRKISRIHFQEIIEIITILTMTAKRKTTLRTVMKMIMRIMVLKF